MIAEIAKRFWIPGATVYDLGCATATTLVEIGRTLGPGAPLPAELDRADPDYEVLIAVRAR